jgi:hypothetical protein
MNKVIGTKFSTKEARNYVTPRTSKEKLIAYNSSMVAAAGKLETYGGRRLLGCTYESNHSRYSDEWGTVKQEIWVSYKIDRETLKLDLDTTHKLESSISTHSFGVFSETPLSFGKNGGTVLAPKRVTVANGKKSPRGMMKATANNHGEITKNSIRYLLKLQDIVSSGSIGKVKGRCSSQLFMLVSNFVYEGGITPEEPRWRDILEAWDFPDGKYLTVYG